jgi:hypothetical protein
MDELLQDFLDANFSDEAQEEYRKSFDLFDYLEFNQAWPPLLDVIGLIGVDPTEALIDRFTNTLSEQLDIAFAQFTIKIVPTATIAERNELLRAIAHFQHLEDYTPLARILESFQQDDVQLARVLADLSMYDEHRIMTLIESFEPKLMGILKEYIYSKEKDLTNQDGSNRRDILSGFRVFCKLYGENTIAALLLKDGMAIGNRFEIYLPYVQEELILGTDEKVAENILSMIMFSGDGYNSPLLLFRKYSFYILQDLNKVTKIEALVLAMISKYLDFKKAEDEKARLSS